MNPDQSDSKGTDNSDTNNLLKPDCTTASDSDEATLTHSYSSTTTLYTTETVTSTRTETCTASNGDGGGGPKKNGNSNSGVSGNTASSIKSSGSQSSIQQAVINFVKRVAKIHDIVSKRKVDDSAATLSGSTSTGLGDGGNTVVADVKKALKKESDATATATKSGFMKSTANGNENLTPPSFRGVGVAFSTVTETVVTTTTTTSNSNGGGAGSDSESATEVGGPGKRIKTTTSNSESVMKVGEAGSSGGAGTTEIMAKKTTFSFTGGFATESSDSADEKSTTTSITVTKTATAQKDATTPSPDITNWPALSQSTSSNSKAHASSQSQVSGKASNSVTGSSTLTNNVSATASWGHVTSKLAPTGQSLQRGAEVGVVVGATPAAAATGANTNPSTTSSGGGNSLQNSHNGKESVGVSMGPGTIVILSLVFAFLIAVVILVILRMGGRNRRPNSSSGASQSTGRGVMSLVSVASSGGNFIGASEKGQQQQQQQHHHSVLQPAAVTPSGARTASLARHGGWAAATEIHGGYNRNGVGAHNTASPARSVGFPGDYNRPSGVWSVSSGRRSLLQGGGGSSRQNSVVWRTRNLSFQKLPSGLGGGGANAMVTGSVLGIEQLHTQMQQGGIGGGDGGNSTSLDSEREALSKVLLMGPGVPTSWDSNSRARVDEVASRSGSSNVNVNASGNDKAMYPMIESRSGNLYQEYGSGRSTPSNGASKSGGSPGSSPRPLLRSLMSNGTSPDSVSRNHQTSGSRFSHGRSPSASSVRSAPVNGVVLIRELGPPQLGRHQHHHHYHHHHHQRYSPPGGRVTSIQSMNASACGTGGRVASGFGNDEPTGMNRFWSPFAPVALAEIGKRWSQGGPPPHSHSVIGGGGGVDGNESHNGDAGFQRRSHASLFSVTPLGTWERSTTTTSRPLGDVVRRATGTVNGSTLHCVAEEDTDDSSGRSSGGSGLKFEMETGGHGFVESDGRYLNGGDEVDDVVPVSRANESESENVNANIDVDVGGDQARGYSSENQHRMDRNGKMAMLSSAGNSSPITPMTIDSSLLSPVIFGPEAVALTRAALLSPPPMPAPEWLDAASTACKSDWRESQYQLRPSLEEVRPELPPPPVPSLFKSPKSPAGAISLAGPRTPGRKPPPIYIPIPATHDDPPMSLPLPWLAGSYTASPYSTDIVTPPQRDRYEPALPPLVVNDGKSQSGESGVTGFSVARQEAPRSGGKKSFDAVRSAVGKKSLELVRNVGAVAGKKSFDGVVGWEREKVMLKPTTPYRAPRLDVLEEVWKKFAKIGGGSK
ncbi:hypothetical protein HDU76_012358 [Blyttiomyces sp. JEL0837]|nr:hypothetical protein HDU76_012358 [Blyttiomyces sp. JEL0837]